MGSEQHYSLRWNDYTVKIVTAFQSLRDEEDFVDVTVACDGHSYSAHKMVLSACSPYFRALLRANPCQHPIVILKDVGHVELERLLEFMYNGEVSIAQDQLAAFLRTAENLKIRGLAGSSDDMDQLGLQRPDVSYSYSSCSVGGGGGGGGAGGTSGRSSPSAGYAPSQGSKDEDVGGDGTGGYHARAESPPSKRRKRPSAPAAGHADSNTATHTSEGVVGEASVEVETGGSVSGAMGGEDDVRLDRRELKSEPGDVMADVYSETSELTDPASHEALDPRQPVLYPLALPGPSGAAGNQDTIGPHEPGDVTNADYKAATRGELDIHLICSSHVKTELTEEWPQQAETLDVALMSLEEEQEDLEDDDPLDVSCDIVPTTTHHPPHTAETSLNAEPVAYKILEKGSNRGGRLLIATNGYSYGVKKTNKDSTLWTCSKRSRELRCRATITQKNNDFRAGRKPHTHPPDPKLPLRAEITAKIKEKIREQPHKRATEIVTKVISSEISVQDRFLAPKSTLLRRTASRFMGKHKNVKENS